MHILCIDDDENFCQSLKKEALALGIRISFASSIGEAKKGINTHDFFAYIIGSKNNGKKFDVKQARTSLIYQILPLASRLKDLKKAKNINFIGGKPMTSKEAHYLLTKLCNLSNQHEPVCDWVDEIPQDLMNSYLNLVFERVGLVRELIQKLKTNPTNQLWDELRNIVHKIAGTAGLYGRVMASELCKELEEKLKNKDYSNLDLESFYRQLYLYVQ